MANDTHWTRKTIIETGFSIINKQSIQVPFVQNFIQNRLDEVREKLKREGKPVWILVLKARQEGCSAKVEADWLADCLKEDNLNCVVISHEKESTKRLLRRVHYYIETCKYPITTKIQSEYEISFPKTNSWFYIGTAGARAFGRGDTIHRVHFCLDGNNGVLLKNGFSKRIGEIKAGDMVMNGVGGFSKVKNVWINDPLKLGYERMIGVKLFGNYDSIVSTPDHRILTREFKTGKPIWKQAKDISLKDYCAFPIKNPSRRVKTIEVPQTKGTIKKKDKIDVNYNLGLLFGWYLSEGSVVKNKVKLAVHQDEECEVDKVLAPFKDFYTSINKRLQKPSKTLVYEIYGKNFADFIEKQVGKTDNKRISDSFYKYGREFLDGLIQGMLEGDGCLKKESEIRFTNTRKQLVYGLKQLIISLRYGYPAIYRTESGFRRGRNEKEKYDLVLMGVGNKKLRRQLGYDFKESFNRKRWRRGKKYYWAKVNKVEELELPEKVYDIEIDHDCHSFTLTNGVVHNSEWAFYQDDTIVDGILQSIPDGGEVVAESTANGFGNRFQVEWDRATKGESKFYPLFFSWADNPEYQIANTILTETEITEEEKILREAFRLTIPQRAWRREKMKEFPNKEAFMQEYPLTPDEAFIYTGTPAFSPLSLKTYITKPPLIGMFVDKGDVVVFEPKEKGWWRRWAGNEPGQGYFGFCDPAEGLDKEDKGDPDYATCGIYDQNLKQVAELQRRLTPAETARQYALAGRYYNQAYLGWERNSAGSAISVVMQEVYPKNRYYEGEDGNLGWQTNVKSRKLMVDGLAEMIKDHSIEIQSEWTVRECLSFRLNSDGKFEAQTGGHDDLVIMTAGVIQMWKDRPVKTMTAIKKALRAEKKKKKGINPYYEN